VQKRTLEIGDEEAEPDSGKHQTKSACLNNVQENNLNVDINSDAQLLDAEFLHEVRRNMQQHSSATPGQLEATILSIGDLVSYCEDDKIAFSLVVPMLVDLLRSGTQETQLGAVRAVSRLAAHSDSQEKISAAGGIPALVSLLDPGCPYAHQKSLEALSNLALHRVNLRDQISEAGAIAPTVRLLSSDVSEVAQDAARLLWCLAKNHPANKVAIVNLKAALPLITLTQGETTPARSQALGALGSLMVGSAKNRAVIQSAAAASSYELPLEEIHCVEEPVTLHIYDVTDDVRVQMVNEVFRSAGTGAFHAGVEVYGKEWSYGFRIEADTGVFSCTPGRNTAHSYRERVSMDVTGFSEAEVDELLETLSKEWKGWRYDLLTNNCCHFVDVLCQALGVGPAPSWLTHLSGTGATLVNGMEAAMQGAQVVAETAQNVANFAVEVAGELNQKYAISDKAEAVAKDIITRTSVHAERAVDQAGKAIDHVQRVISQTGTATSETERLQESTKWSWAENMGKFANGIVSGISHFWEVGPCEVRKPDENVSADLVSSVKVTLECVRAAGMDLTTIPHWQACLSHNVNKHPWCINTMAQLYFFINLIPDKLHRERLSNTHIELSWEPPCLYLRKSVNAVLTVNGSRVKQSTFILLHNSAIGLCGQDDGELVALFRVRLGDAPRTSSSWTASSDQESSYKTQIETPRANLMVAEQAKADVAVPLKPEWSNVKTIPHWGANALQPPVLMTDE